MMSSHRILFLLKNETVYTLIPEISTALFGQASPDAHIALNSKELCGIVQRYMDSIEFHTNGAELHRIKDRINMISEKEWDCLKKKSNPYECVNTHGGVANYTPISRAYFKMYEIFAFFKSAFYKRSREEHLRTLHLAEGPGGFMECILLELQRMGFQDFHMYGITLMNEDKTVPAWKKSSFFLRQNRNIHLVSGADGTGDLYNPDNIRQIAQNMGGKAFFITGDGGFDVMTDYNHQETITFPLIYCQIIAALMNQAEGGMFVLKVFDTYDIQRGVLDQGVSSMEYRPIVPSIHPHRYMEQSLHKPNTSQNWLDDLYMV